MLRTYAEVGDEFVLINTEGVPRTFVITGIKGEGGSALVYSAETNNGMKSVIKEFFPILARDYSFARTDGDLYIDKVVTISEEFLSKAQGFVRSVSIMNRLAFSEETAEETLAAELLSNSNGIPYIVTEWNPQRVVCYDDVKTNSLNEIAIICLRLTEIISEYHNMGYIHLDIKPSNILWSKKYNYIKLFDFDAVNLAIDRPRFCGASVTQSYAAPEAEAHDAVNAKSDLYSIGAILFERVMDRKLDPLLGDRVNFRYESELPNKPLITNESDEAVTLVKTILHGTICAAPGKRMSSERLIELLKRLSEITSPKSTIAIKPAKHEFSGPLRNILVAACATIICASAVIPVIFFHNDSTKNTIDDRKTLNDKYQTKDTEDESSHTCAESADIPSKNASSNIPEAFTEDLFSNEGDATDDSMQFFAPTQEVNTSTAPVAPTAPAAPPASQNTAVTVNLSAEPNIPPNTTTTAGTPANLPTSSSSSLKKPDETSSPSTNEQTTMQTTVSTSEEIIPTNSDDFSYTVFGGGVELTAYNGNGGDVVIPQNIDGMPVIKLSYRLFENRDDITSVTMPEGLKIIDYSVFWGCTGLSEIIIPESVVSIGSNAFYGASGLHSIYIPQNVMEIGGLCFGWTSIETIEVSPQNDYFSSVDGVFYDKSGEIMLCYPCCKPNREFDIPENVIEIYSFAFDRPKYLEKLHIGKNLRRIDDCQIFEYVNEITADTDNDYFTAYDGSLFNKDLTKMWFFPPNSQKTVWTLPETVKELGWYCFNDLKNLKRLEILVMPETLAQGAIQETFNCVVFFNDEKYTPGEFYELYLSGAY